MDSIDNNNINNVDIYENDIDLYLHEFMKVNDVPDLRSASQAVWNACLMYIQRHVFNNRDNLKQKSNVYTKNTLMATNCNSYDFDLLNEICDYYIYLTALYDKECSIYGFCKLLNIHHQTVQEWGKNYSNSNRLSTKSCDLYKKLTNEREQSLTAKLVSMKHPTALAIILNKDYEYNLPGVSRESNQPQRALTADQLPKLGQTSPAALPDQVIEQ